MGTANSRIKYMKNKVIIVFLLAFVVVGCASKKDDAPVIATVNGQPIYLKDFQRELSIRARRDPSLKIDKNTLSDLTDTMIKRQLIIEEAMKKKMAEEDRFRDTIKAFWEQTLIRDFVDYKNREFDEYVFVTGKEITDRYNELKKKNSDIPPLEDVHDQVKAVVAQEKKIKALDDWLEEKKKQSRIHINQKIISEQAKK